MLQSWRSVTETGNVVVAISLVLLLVSAALFLLGLPRLPFAYSLYVAPQLFLLATRHAAMPLMSSPRYILVLFPIFTVLALLLRHRAQRAFWLAGSCALLMLLCSTYLLGYFVA